jgi:hypothetical protein
MRSAECGIKKNRSHWKRRRAQSEEGRALDGLRTSPDSIFRIAPACRGVALCEDWMA